ncbi:hypothetical protein M9H77_34979 [Catharanthus roseus]|uniref:Uncharacterized protein n=1 Tax=Catharanthus roseus TaxID=4058 RepID=A0ACB9ZPF0_CATRO|nr:hypothetical protein M9H77_34979 [Catharanthus roseus]
MVILVPYLHPGLKFVKNQVNGRVSSLHCTWLVSRTRASSDDVDGFLTLRVDPLEEGRSTLRAWPNRLAWDVCVGGIGEVYLLEVPSPKAKAEGKKGNGNEVVVSEGGAVIGIDKECIGTCVVA